MLWDWLLWMEWEPWSVCGGRPVLWNFEKWHGDDKQCKKRTSGEISTRHALHKENESKYSTIQMQNKYNTRTMHNVLSHEYWWKGTSEGRDPLPIACFLLPFGFLASVFGWSGCMKRRLMADGPWLILWTRSNSKGAGGSEQRGGYREPRAIRSRDAKRTEG